MRCLWDFYLEILERSSTPVSLEPHLAGVAPIRHVCNQDLVMPFSNRHLKGIRSERNGNLNGRERIETFQLPPRSINIVGLALRLCVHQCPARLHVNEVTVVRKEVRAT